MKKIILITLILFLLKGTVYAGIFSVEPSYLGIGARSLGLGGTTAGTFKRSEAMFLNPAGLAEVELVNFNYMYGKYFDQDVSYSIFSIVYPFKFCNVGFGYGGIGVGGIYQTTAPVAPGIMPGLGSELSYSNRVFIFSAAKNYKKLNYGLNIKIFKQNLSGGNVTGGSSGGYDLDIGLSYKIKNLKLYLSSQNLLATKITTESGAQEDMPGRTILGISTELMNKKIILAGDIRINGQTRRPVTCHTGIEYQPYEFISFRAGIEQEPASSNARYTNFTLGIGLYYAGFNFDYAWKQANNLSQNNSNYFTFGFMPQRRKGEAFIKAIASPPVVTIAQREKIQFRDILKVPEKKEVEYVSGLEIAQGKSDGLFYPKKALTKVEAAKMIFKSLKLKGRNESTSISYVINGKKDSYNVVMQVKEKGKADVVRKFEATGIKPLKRYYFNWQGEDNLGNDVNPGLYEYEIKVKDDKNAENYFKGEISVNAEKIVSTAKMPAQFKYHYKDIPATHWAAGMIYKLSQEGIFKEDKVKIFKPNRSITHYELLTALVSAVEKNNIKFYSNKAYKSVMPSSIKGISKLSVKEKKYLQLFYQGMEKIYPSLNLNTPVTRAQAAKIIYNFIEML